MLNYEYAELSKGKRWYVHYRVLNPSSGQLERKRIYLDHIKELKLRERYARKLCNKINDKLDQGWNPFVSNTNNKQYTEITKAFNYLMTYKGSYLSKRSIDTYNNHIAVFFEFLKREKMDNIFVFEFKDNHAIAFFDYLLMDRKISGRTYNNYLLDFRSFFNFFVKQRYAVTNPFHAVSDLPETEKEKQPFTIEEATRYRDYCLENEPEFYTISGLCYYCAMRPAEITRLKVGSIDRVNKQIRLPGSSTKTKKNRTVPVPDVFWPLLENFIKDCPDNAFLCSTGFVPGLKPSSSVQIAKKFRSIAETIGLPTYVKFYSLKDTAAERLDQNNIGLKTIRDLFGHQNISTTDKYMRGIRNRELEGLRTTFPPL